MKLKSISVVFAALIGVSFVFNASGADYTVHEWGTFTSLQGGDGDLLDWNPLQNSDLPAFVYSNLRPGSDHRIFPYPGKVVMRTKQRLETPVVYFYSDKRQIVDLTVRFPAGRITEWYPQADLIGPSTRLVGGMARLNESESVIGWSNLLVLPENQMNSTDVAMLTNDSHNHYFAARETDSDAVLSSAAFTLSRPKPMTNMDSFLSCSTPRPPPRLATMVSTFQPDVFATNAPLELEKFLFYRGAGNFSTPLHVTMKSDDLMELSNNGTEPLARLLLVNLDEVSGTFVQITNLLPGEKITYPVPRAKIPIPRAEFPAALSESMASALVAAGLYPREASAMVRTWTDSWFQESGLRVLYLLPTKWTDATLPMWIFPQPKELTRVMVGRAEILPPQLEKKLAEQLSRAKDGDADATAQVRATFARLGRFASPALDRAVRVTKLDPVQITAFASLLSQTHPN